MSKPKKEILEKIYEQYGLWIAEEKFSCHKGCALCCTQNVMITAIEGDRIYEYIRGKNREKWVAEKLKSTNGASRPAITTNGYARICLSKSEVAETDEQRADNYPCPFLDDECCTIYPVRPFSCRSFASYSTCKINGAAELTDKLVLVNTITLQIIEHLGQKEYWGNMIDVLLQLLHKDNH